MEGRRDRNFMDDGCNGRKMVDDRGYDIESKRSSYLCCGGGKVAQEDKEREGYTRKKERSSQSDSPGADPEHGISVLNEIHRFNSNDEETLRGSPALLE